MKQKHIIFAISITIFSAIFFGCEGMATLFHGPKPEAPPVTYTVTYNANGASGTAPTAQTVNAGTVIRLPDKGGLTKTGYAFTGWCESLSGADTIYSVGTSLTVTGNMVFYAQWLDSSTPQFTVTFNANGATGGSAPASQTVYSSSSIVIPAHGTLAYSGKTFGGWNTQANGGGTNYEAGAAYTVTGHVTLYAKWQSEVQYTVTYSANGGSGTVPQAQTVDPGTVITLPGQGSMSNIGKIFKGWNTAVNGSGTGFDEGEAYTVNVNSTFYAQWESVPIEPPGSTLSDKLAYIASNAGDGVVYDIVVNDDVHILPTTIATMGRNITVNIRSASSADIKTIQLANPGHLFSVGTNVTLKLQDITLKGLTNNVALVLVGQLGKLILDAGAKITENNNNSTDFGGGINVDGGDLEMNEGSEIIGNNVTSGSGKGGGIYVADRGTVTLRGGLISENVIGTRGYPWQYGNGGGIYISGNSTVTMTGGIISKNSTTWCGGGIYIDDSGSSFTKINAPGSNDSGIIYGSTGVNANIASQYSEICGLVIARNFGTNRYRNATLGYGDTFSSQYEIGWE